ncbi:GGDEF domain-containing protein [Lysobacter sp. N42]|uniref:GGDEF domain-containing protein n=2 Tax=Gammaproteobacteria TaxID=1236 RepID=UPI001042CDA8|nr:GGDEF domain-containing protein [Lysobacter sp. N42]TCZ90822.1 diguanylate cyclase [Lysobacter sp. N42]
MNSHPESHAIAVGNEGFIYVGTNTGIKVYDGENWTFIATPNRKLVRSLTAGKDRRMYVGGYDSFGYIEPDTTGQLVFHDLSQEFTSLRTAGYADIWDLLVTEDAVYFKAVRDLFRYDINTGATSVWQFEGRFGAINAFDNQVYVQYRGLGLAHYRQGNFELVSEHSLWHEHIYDLVGLGEDGWLANTRSGQWLHVDNPYQPEQDNYLVPQLFNLDQLPSGDEFYDVAEVGPGQVALAHKEGSVFIFHWDTQNVERFPVSYNTILQLAGGFNNAIYALAEQDVVRIEWPSQWRIIGPQTGIRGRVHNIRNWHDRWFTLTSAGVFELISEPVPHFEKVSWTNHEAWDLMELNGDYALLADSYQIQQVSDDGLTPLTHATLYPRLFQESKFRENYTFVGTELGLAIWHPVHGLTLEWTEPGTLVNSIAQLDAQTLLLGTSHRGVIEVTLDESYSMVTRVHYVGEESGISYGLAREAILSQFDSQLVISTAKGLYNWENGTATPEGSGLWEALEAEQAVRIEGGVNNDYWAYSFNYLYHFNGGDPDLQKWQNVQFNGLLPGAITTLFVNDAYAQYVVLGSHSALVTLQPQATQQSFNTEPVRMNSIVKIKGDSAERLELNQNYNFESGRFALQFNFAMPNSSAVGETLYSARLEGYEDHFSEWNRSTRITYSNLSPGSYSFMVKALSPNGEITKTVPLNFTIQPPWYDNTWIRALAVLLIIAMLFLVVKYFIRRRTRLLALEKRRLKDMVEERTQDLANANKKLESMANVDGLTGIANRRRLDQFLGEAVHHCMSSGKPLSLLQIDVDHFKSYNDTNGHLAGDNVLKEVAHALQTTLRRQEDLVARFGGEEFTVVMPGASQEHALDVAEAMRQHVESTVSQITISVGVAVMQPENITAPEHAIQTVLERADKALYEAKESGRNRVC